jgi:hypothetical protein
MKRTNWIIIAVVALLLVVYMVTKEDKVSVGIKTLVIPSIDEAKADRIVLETKDNKVLLIKKDSKWWLESPEKKLFLADQAKVASLLDSLRDMKHSHYVTSLEDKLPELGLNADHANTITLYSGEQPIWSMQFGKSSEGSGRYVKLADSHEVHVVRGSFSQLNNRSLEDFRDRHVWDLDEGDLSEFVLLGGPKAITLTKDTDHWQLKEANLEADFRVDQAAVQFLVKNILGLRATAFIDNNKDLGELKLTIKAKAQYKPEKELALYVKDNNTFFIKNSLDNTVFEISKNSAENISKKIEDLRDLSLVSFDANSVVTINLKNKDSLVSLHKDDNIWLLKEPKMLPKDFVFSEEAVPEFLTFLNALQANRLATNKDIPELKTWQQNYIVELKDKANKTYMLSASKIKNSKDDYLMTSSNDKKTYVISGYKIAFLLKGLDAFKKINKEMPHFDENTQGLDSLPPDLQKKLLDAARKSQH